LVAPFDEGGICWRSKKSRAASTIPNRRAVTGEIGVRDVSIAGRKPEKATLGMAAAGFATQVR
jgi:hypothetical protein